METGKCSCPHLKDYEMCCNGFTYFIVLIQDFSIGNLPHVLKINEAVDPRRVSNAILFHFRIEQIQSF